MDLISMEAAGKRLGVSFWTAARWARLGILPSVKIGRRRLCDPADLDMFIQRMKQRGVEGTRAGMGKR